VHVRELLGKTVGYPRVIKCKKITEGAKSWGEVMCMKAEKGMIYEVGGIVVIKM
jgi:hypothetical protein